MMKLKEKEVLLALLVHIDILYGILSRDKNLPMPTTIADLRIKIEKL